MVVDSKNKKEEEEEEETVSFSYKYKQIANNFLSILDHLDDHAFSTLPLPLPRSIDRVSAPIQGRKIQGTRRPTASTERTFLDAPRACIVAAIRVEKGARFLLLVRTARNANRMKGSGREWTRAEKKGNRSKKEGGRIGKGGRRDVCRERRRSARRERER